MGQGDTAGVSSPDKPAGSEPLLRRAPDALWRATLRGVIIHPAAGAEPLLVTSPGDLVWTLLADPIARSEMAAALAQHFNADVDAVDADIGVVLDQLMDVGAVVEVTDPAGDRGR